jgi:hypothetical protein
MHILHVEDDPAGIFLVREILKKVEGCISPFIEPPLTDLAAELPIPQRRALRLFCSCGGLTIWTRHGFFLFPALLSTPPYDTTERSSMLSSEI